MMDQQKSKADELFFVVDEQDHPLDPLPRKLVHGHGVWHRVAHVWLVHDKGQILCRQRSFAKENNPGCWEGFFGGHMSPGETYEQAAVRETHEELGITIEISDLTLFKIYKYHHPTGYNNEFQAIFVVRWNGDLASLQFNDGEVEQVAWQTIATIRNKLTAHDSAWTFCGYELDALNFIETLTK